MSQFEMPDILSRTVYQNDGIIVIDKPWGWLSVPSRLGANDTRPCVGTALQRQLKKRVWPVHRLDFEVSGILVFALNASVHKYLCHMFEHRLVTKTYEAWTMMPGGESFQTKIGITEKNAPMPEILLNQKTIYTWNSNLVRGKKRSFEAAHGQPSITSAQWIDKSSITSKSNKSWEILQWKLVPHTGRPHQLRFEMYKHGIPIIGDTLYGGAPVFRSEGIIGLSCTSIEFSEEYTNSRFEMPQIVKSNHNFLKLFQDELL